MKYIGAFGLMLICNEIISLFALCMILLFFLADIKKEADKR